MKYEVGDRVRIKDIGWYNKYKDEDGDVSCGEYDFVEGMKKFCSETLTISEDVGDGYLMLEDYYGYVWTDEMFECKVEEETKTKFKVGDKVRIKDIDWYEKNKSKSHGTIACGDKYFEYDMKEWCGKIMTILEVYQTCYIMQEDGAKDLWTDEMIECLVEEETPKFKINDIVFVKNLGWVRITNGYWDSFANEYIYEAIGFNGEGEYDCISQSNIEGQMLPESENPHTGGNKITLDEYKNNDKEWLFNKLAMLDNITALESIQDIFNHLQQSKYPKTYEECYKIMGVKLSDCYIQGYKSPLLEDLQELLICRDAYWKIYGEEMGLDKPWEPTDSDYITGRYCIFVHMGNIICDTPAQDCILTFPTAEMRDTFYENFKEEIENCKELL